VAAAESTVSGSADSSEPALPDQPAWRDLVFDVANPLPQILPPWARTPTNMEGINEMPRYQCHEQFSRVPFEKGYDYKGGPTQHVTHKLKLTPHDDPIKFFEMYAPPDWRFKTWCEETNRKCVDRSYGLEVCD